MGEFHLRFLLLNPNLGPRGGFWRVRRRSGGPAVSLTDCWGLNWIRWRFTLTDATETIRVVVVNAVGAPAWRRKRRQQLPHRKKTVHLDTVFILHEKLCDEEGLSRMHNE